jgi:hypothetical protein
MSDAMTAVPVTPPASRSAEFARPFVLIAVVAFVIGFLGYVALDRPVASQDLAAIIAAEPALAAPASDAWNLPKHI